MFLAIGNRLLDFLKSAGLFIHEVAVTLGGPGLFLIALADSSFLSIPQGNDLLVVVLSIGQGWSTMLYYVLMAVLGSLAGCMILYLVGRRGGSFFLRRVDPKRQDNIRRLYQRWGLWTVLVASILPPPTPFKLFVVSAGVFRVALQRFALAVVVGRSIRYLFFGSLAVLYGEAALHYMEKNLETVGSILMVAFLLIVAAYAFRHFMGRRRMSQKEAV